MDTVIRTKDIRDYVFGRYEELKEKDAHPETILGDIILMQDKTESYLKPVEWIKCKDRMPEEHESIFSNLLVAGKINACECPYRLISDNVLVTYRDKNGETDTGTAHTRDGKWNTTLKFDVVAWAKYPEPYSGE